MPYAVKTIVPCSFDASFENMAESLPPKREHCSNKFIFELQKFYSYTTLEILLLCQREIPMILWAYPCQHLNIISSLGSSRKVRKSGIPRNRKPKRNSGCLIEGREHIKRWLWLDSWNNEVIDQKRHSILPRQSVVLTLELRWKFFFRYLWQVS